MHSEPGLKIGSYRLIEKIGEGGMGVVWKARDTALDRDVAIKFLPAAFDQDPERMARFEREAKAVAALAHPGIMAIYALAGNTDQALEWLDRGVRNGDERAAWLRRDKFLASIQSQPRFQLILGTIDPGRR